MKGQWIGTFGGQISGDIVINVDEVGDRFIGSAFTLPGDPQFPQAVSNFVTDNRSPDFTGSAAVTPIDPRNGLPCRWEDIESLYITGTNHSKSAKITGHFETNSLTLKAETDIGIVIESNIIKKPFTDRSELRGETKTWDEYKSYVATLSENECFYRGQREPWKLRTSFHRRGRYDLFRFLTEDIRILHRRLTAKTEHIFNLQIPDENGAFLNLAQHHGYPTPLLDWTLSPYVAAFFAFRYVPRKSLGDDNVRIFIFDQRKWKSDWGQLSLLNAPGLHLSILEFLAIENERLIPQQAATTLSNVDDIETYVGKKQDEKQCSYLWAIDIPQTERNKVIKELSYMGITAGSMFPGFDGACEELREKLFDE